MGFSWVQDISVGADVEAADMNEIMTNLNTIYSDLGINRPGCSGAGWTEFPVIKDVDTIESADLQELRDVTDYAYDNKCPAFNATHYATDDSTDDDTVQATYRGAYYSPYRSNDLSSNDDTYEIGYHLSYLMNVQSGFFGSDNDTVNSPHDSVFCTTACIAVA